MACIKILNADRQFLRESEDKDGRNINVIEFIILPIIECMAR